MNGIVITVLMMNDSAPGIQDNTYMKDYLAVEEAFLQHNYGSDYGELYKPDSMNFGGGPGKRCSSIGKVQNKHSIVLYFLFIV